MTDYNLVDNKYRSSVKDVKVISGEKIGSILHSVNRYDIQKERFGGK